MLPLIRATSYLKMATIFLQTTDCGRLIIQEGLWIEMPGLHTPCTSHRMNSEFSPWSLNKYKCRPIRNRIIHSNTIKWAVWLISDKFAADQCIHAKKLKTTINEFVLACFLLNTFELFYEKYWQLTYVLKHKATLELRIKLCKLSKLENIRANTGMQLCCWKKYFSRCMRVLCKGIFLKKLKNAIL